MRFNNWNVPAAGPSIPEDLLRANCSPLLAALLAKRGMKSLDAAEKYLFFDSSLLEDPLRLADMPAAAGRVTRALEQGEVIAVYGDYDVDGITSTCLLSDYLQKRGGKVICYIPDRLDEGYGLNKKAIEALALRGVTLIITVDCGVTNIEEADYAASLGIDMVITDHHECKDILPNAVAVVDPKRPDDCSNATFLAGVGVAFKLVCAMDGNADRVVQTYCDLVAVGTVADVMPLTGENRFLVREGLNKLCSDRCLPGLKALMNEAGIADRRLTATSISFALAPRINAAGRLRRTEVALELLKTSNRRQAEELAQTLCEMNKERQTLETAIWKDALDMLKGRTVDAPIVLAKSDWHQGVIGIAASRLAEAYSVPAIMICTDEQKNLGKGSCRSTGSFNLYDALSECSDCLIGFGGHAMAAGLTILPEKIDEFRERIAACYQQHPDQEKPALEAEIMVNDPRLLTLGCVESLDLLEPCGNANPRAVLYLENAYLEQISPIATGKHVRLKLSKFGVSYDAVYFNCSVDKLGAREGNHVDVVFTPQINEFRGNTTVQLVLADLRRRTEKA